MKLRIIFDLSFVDSFIHLNVFTHLTGGRCVLFDKTKWLLYAPQVRTTALLLPEGWPTLVQVSP